MGKNTKPQRLDSECINLITLCLVNGKSPTQEQVDNLNKRQKQHGLTIT